MFAFKNIVRGATGVVAAAVLLAAGGAQAHHYEQWELDAAAAEANAAYTAYLEAESAFLAFDYEAEARRLEDERDWYLQRCTLGAGITPGDISMCHDSIMLEFYENILMIEATRTELNSAMMDALSLYLSEQAEYEGMIAHA